jgi:hypothetical protein
MCRKITSITHVYFNFYVRRPSLSSLLWSWVGGHDCFVDAAAGALVAGCLVLCHILAVASLLMIAFALVACCAGVPNGNIVAAREAVVVVVVPFVGVGGCVAAAPRTGVGRGWWDACNWCWCGGSRWCIVVASSPSAVSSTSSATSASAMIVALIRGCWWWCRRRGICCGWGYYCWGSGEHCQLLLQGCHVCA